MTMEIAGNRLSVGVPEFDLLLGDGLPQGAAMLLRGGPGCGKTLLGLHYTAAGSAAHQNALIISFSDNEAALRSGAHKVGIGITHVQCLDFTPPPGHLAGTDRYEIFAPADVDGGWCPGASSKQWPPVSRSASMCRKAAAPRISRDWPAK